MDADLALRSVVWTLLLPPVGPVLVAIVGLALLRRRPRAGRLLVAGGLALLLALSLPVVADLLSVATEKYPPLADAQPVPAGAIVVLSGSIRHNGSDPADAALEPTTLERLAGGAALARRTGLPLVLSGGAVLAGPAEADVMQATLRRDFGLEARYVERASRTTHENARATAVLLAPAAIRSIVLVTSAVHMRRAVAEFEAAGFTVTPAPVGATRGINRSAAAWLPGCTALARSRAALHELVAGPVARLGRDR